MNVTEITTKQDLFTEIARERQKLDKTLVTLSEADMIQPGACGEWSVKDMLAHLLGWQQMFLNWYRAGQRGEVPKLPAPDLKWSELDILNRRIYEQYRDQSLDTIRARFEASDREVLDTVQAMSEEELFEPNRYAWTGTWRVYRYAWAATGAHYRWARTEIRKWQKAQGRP